MPEQKITFGNLRKLFLESIRNKYEGTIYAWDASLYNIILVEYDGIPKRVSRIQPEVANDLYRIIAAPVSSSIKEHDRNIATDYINTHSWGRIHTKSILSTTGGCLTIVDSDTKDRLLTQFKIHSGINNLTNEGKNILYTKFIQDMCINVEFALLVLLLKKANESYVHRLKLTKSNGLHFVQKKYKLNQLFIAELQECCFGSVSEQIAAFELMMPYYLKESITRQKSQAIDYILSKEEAQKKNSFQDLITVGGFIFALIFGLPAVYETLSLIRSVCFFIEDIPIVTVENASITLWLFLMLFFILFGFHNNKNHKLHFD